jgi:cysteine-rich repeat protein
MALGASAQTTLTLSSWVPPSHTLTETQKEWCEMLAQKVAGKIKCNVLPRAVSAPPATFDSVRNGSETDVDCGGACAAKCDLATACLADTDCTSHHCAGALCVECEAATDCPASTDECLVPACVQNVCDTAPSALNTRVSEQTPGDCQLTVCDGAGATTDVIDHSDLPDDGVDCTTDLCIGGVPSNVATSAGATCSENGGEICDGAGMCVASICGDGRVMGSEACDDLNTADSDGCSSVCLIEVGFQCIGEPSACSCVGAEIDCGGTCVDALTDPANCGACGNACASDESCESGSCVALP